MKGARGPGTNRAVRGPTLVVFDFSLKIKANNNGAVLSGQAIAAAACRYPGRMVNESGLLHAQWTSRR